MIAVDILLDGLFAAVAAIGFGAISDPPVRAFPCIALLAAVGHALRFCLMSYAGIDIATASLCAAVVIGFGSLWLGRGIRCPMTVLYIPALLPMVPGIYAYKTVFALTMVQCNFSQYSSRYHDFCAGKVWPSFDPACAGGALMDLGVYNVSYVVGLFGSPNKVHYAANITRGIDTSGVLTMEYRSFKAVSINAKDSSSPARYIIQGTKGYLLQKSTANFCGGVTFHPYKGKEEHFNLSAGRPRQAAEFHAFARAIESEDMELCSRMLDTSVAVSRVLETARRDAGIRFTTDL